MSQFSRFINLFLMFFLLGGTLAAQLKERVEVSAKVTPDVAKDCKNLISGRALNASKPIFPAAAKVERVGGTILLTAKIDEKGQISIPLAVAGHKALQNASAAAASKSKFTPSVCDGEPVISTVVLTYNFIPTVDPEKYFTPAKVVEFADLKIDSPFYEAVLNLTENYQLAFGFENQKFYADAPLARGDFAHFLRLTLDLLSARAAVVNKLPRDINLYFPHNLTKITSANDIKDIKRSEPFYDSLRTLLLKYDVALVNDRNEFQSNRYLTNNELIDLWSKIFGEEAIPVNFTRTTDGDRIVSRGEFALFLQESLQVLTYKVLP